MPWVKIPKEHHPLFVAALPKDARVRTIAMFGGLAGTVNGNMFGGLFGRSVMVKLGDADHTDALKLDGAEPFDPMGKGHVMSNSVLLPETVMDEPAELRGWLKRAFDYTATLPKKKAAGAKKPAKKRPAKKKSKK